MTVGGPPTGPTTLDRLGEPDARAVEAPPVGLYVHVPFCVSVCPYCDFVVVAGSESRGPRARIAPFVAAILQELELRADALDGRWGRPGTTVRPPLASVYLGGGTPSLLPAPTIGAILERISRRYGLTADAEITIEANPGPDELGDTRAFVPAGVTRLSIGAQSFVDRELRTLGRRHRATDIAAAVAAARDANVRSISLDLLYDVPDQTPASWRTTLDAALALEPDHLSLYALSLDDPDADGLTGPTGDHLPVRPGVRRWRDRARPRQDEDRAADAYAVASTALAAAGYDGYELSNWARPGHASRHNLGYWERRPIEAVGPGAHAFDGLTRRWNAARLDAYLAALLPSAGPPRLPPGGSETPDGRAVIAERMILGLRLGRGLPTAWLDWAPLDAVGPWAVDRGLAEVVEGRLRLTTRGRLLSNEVFSRLV